VRFTDVYHLELNSQPSTNANRANFKFNLKQSFNKLLPINIILKRSRKKGENVQVSVEPFGFADKLTPVLGLKVKQRKSVIPQEMEWVKLQRSGFDPQVVIFLQAGWRVH